VIPVLGSQPAGDVSHKPIIIIIKQLGKSYFTSALQFGKTEKRGREQKSE